MRRHGSPSVLMLGTFGLRPKGTLRARAVSIGQVIEKQGWRVTLGTTPWDFPDDAGRWWDEGGVRVRNTRVVRPALWPLAATEMIRWAKDQPPDLVHLFKPKGFGDLASRWLRRSVPVVVDMDDWEGDGGWNDVGLYGPVQRRIFDWQERSWPRQAAAVTTASRELHRRALDLGGSVENVHYIPNGLTRQRFEELRPVARHQSRYTAQLGTDGPRVLLYTRFVEFSVDDLVVTLRSLVDERPGLRLVIAGGSHDGRAEQRLSALASSCGLGAAVHNLGWIAPEDLAAIAGACDVAIHPFEDTCLNRSKASVKLLELMATGIPIVATAVGENAEFVEHHVSGLLSRPGDWVGLASAVHQLLVDEELRFRLGIESRRRVEHEYLWEQLACRVLAVYEQVTASATR